MNAFEVSRGFFNLAFCLAPMRWIKSSRRSTNGIGEFTTAAMAKTPPKRDSRRPRDGGGVVGGFDAARSR